MKNFIRITKLLETTEFTPEYADEQLAFELILAKTPNNVSDYSIRLYTADYRFIGSCSLQVNPQKPTRKQRLYLSTDQYVTFDNYLIYVYANGKPCWYAPIHFHGNYEKWDKAPLQPLTQYPELYFFAQKLCFSTWWKKFYCGRYQAPVIEQVINRLYRCDADGLHQQPNLSPTLLVTGSNLTKIKGIASVILGGYFTNDDASFRFNFSLEELRNGVQKWDELKQKLASCKAITVEIPELKYDSRTCTLMNLMANAFRNRKKEEAAIILYGLQEHILALRKHCSEFKELLTDVAPIQVHTNPSNFSTPANELKPEEPEISQTESDAKSDDDFDLLLESLAPEPFYYGPAFENQNSAGLAAEQELQEMIGLKRLKEEMQEARLLALFSKERQELCIEEAGENRHHMLFLGNPGTGKTTVARLVGQIYHSIGLLSKGHTIETNRAQLMGEFIGQTEKKIKEEIEKARGGVLFIDEAYTLVAGHDTDSRDYGKEVINALLPVLSDPNPDLIVIFAGYEDKMTELLRTNSGLKDRFPLHFHFDDFSAAELLEIALQILEKRNFTLTEAASTELQKVIEEASRHRNEDFGNGRWVHNFIEQGVIKSMAIRVMSAPHRADNPQLLSLIQVEDILRAEQKYLKPRVRKEVPAPRIGFRA